MIEISFKADQRGKTNKKLIQKAAAAALAQQAAPEASTLSILITDDAQIQALNRDYRSVDAPTVFLYFEVHEPDPGTGRSHLGEIIISLPYAARQAEKNNHPLDAEIQLLVVHGVLHIMGHDHAEEEEKAIMWAAQSEILATLGLSGIKIPEE